MNLKGLVGPAIFIVVCVLLYKAGAFDWAQRRWEQLTAPEDLSDYAAKMTLRISDDMRCTEYRDRILDLGSSSGDRAERIEAIRTAFEAAGRDRCAR